MKLFSTELEEWLHGTKPKTLASLIDTFGQRSHAVVLLLMLFPSALPLPTGGVTNILEVLAMLVALQMIVGRKTPWFPQRWQNHPIGDFGTDRIIPNLMRVTKIAEKYQRVSMQLVLKSRVFTSVIGTIFLVFIVGAFLAPPFSGLDTLPSIGVVLMALSLLVGDVLLLTAALFIGSLGVYLSYSAWDFVLRLF